MTLNSWRPGAGSLAVAVVLSVVGMGQARAQTPPSTQPGSGNIESYIEVLRSDLKTQKSLIITDNMDFTAAEAEAFWPIYRKYEADLTKLNDEKLAIIKDYAVNYKTMSDEKAKELAQRSMAVEEKRNSLKKKYYKEFAKVLPGKTAARFYQVDNRLDLLGSLKIASELPLVEK